MMWTYRIMDDDDLVNHVERGFKGQLPCYLACAPGYDTTYLFWVKERARRFCAHRNRRGNRS